MVRILLLTVLFAISSSFIFPFEPRFLKSIRKQFGPTLTCSTELKKFNECIKPYESFIDFMEHGLNMNPKVLYDLKLMTEVSKVTRNISSCFGHDGQCKMSKLVAFGLDAADFVESKV
ncbi:unnamed protein product [Caenorhabditis nigoni]